MTAIPQTPPPHIHRQSRRNKKIKVSDPNDRFKLLPAAMRGLGDPTEFELEARRLGLSQDGWTGNQELRSWVTRWYQTRYVPEKLLDAWGLKPAWKDL